MLTLLTRQSTGPRPLAAAISSSAAAGSARSATTPSAAPASSCARSTRSESRPVTTTRAPSAARSRAVASPIPAVEPVTTQTRSRRSRSMARASLRQDVSVTTLLLARHGETDWNRDRRWQGHADRPLTDRGRAQSAALAERLADIALDAFYASDLQRARETAAVVAAKQGLEVIELRDLREVDVGSWEGLTREEAEASFPDGYRRWLAGGTGWDDGETYEQMSARVIAAVERIAAAHKGGRVLVVSHGGPIRAIHAAALGLAVDAYRRIRPVE